MSSNSVTTNSRPLTNYILVKRFCDETGFTPKAIEGKIRTGAWMEGVQYRKGPDGHVYVSLTGYEKWVEKGQA